jgi:hypothetical protein
MNGVVPPEREVAKERWRCVRWVTGGDGAASDGGPAVGDGCLFYLANHKRAFRGRAHTFPQRNTFIVASRRALGTLHTTRKQSVTGRERAVNQRGANATLLDVTDHVSYGLVASSRLFQVSGKEGAGDKNPWRPPGNGRREKGTAPHRDRTMSTNGANGRRRRRYADLLSGGCSVTGTMGTLSCS